MRDTRAALPGRRGGREVMPQIVIEPVRGGFALRIDGEAVRVCGDQLDAHHWAKHAFKAVNQGLRRAGEVSRAMPRLCLKATKFNLHR